MLDPLPADADDAARMVEQAKDTFGGLHAIVNPAGILRDTMFHKMTEEDWDKVIAVHLRGSFNVTRASIELFREQKDGAYVLFTSTSGLIGNIGQANYAAAKMGIVGLSRIVAMEGARNNVRSNVIAPFAWTRMIESIPVKDEASAQRVERFKKNMRADQVAHDLLAQLALGAGGEVLGGTLAQRRQAHLGGDQRVDVVRRARGGEGRAEDEREHETSLSARRPRRAARVRSERHSEGDAGISRWRPSSGARQRVRDHLIR